MTPETMRHPTLVSNVAKDMKLTIRLLVRRYVMHGGAYELASLGAKVQKELAEEVEEADLVDSLVVKLFAKK
jgi:acetylglutamate kinase